MKGQSLVEVLIGIALGALFILGAASLIAPALQITKQATNVQTQAGLASELSNNLRAWSAGDWHNILNLSTTSANQYYLIASSSPFTATSGTESITIGTTTYTRYFYVDDMYRDSGGNATSTSSGNNYDPSTKKFTLVYGVASSTTSTIALYLSRNQNNSFDQTNWTGGDSQAGPIKQVNAKFASSSNIDYATQAGSIALMPSNPAPIMLMDTQYATSLSTTTLGLTFVNKPAAGNLILVAISSASQTIATPTDNFSNTYTLVASTSFIGTATTTRFYVSLYYATNVASGANFTVSEIAGGSADKLSMAIFSYSGFTTAAALDKSNKANGTSTTSFNSGNVTTIGGLQLYFGVSTTGASTTVNVDPGGANWGSVVIIPSNLTGQPLWIEAQILTVVTTISASWGTVSNTRYGAIIGTFKTR
jgi:Tfp pilus assembly protein PilV